MRIKVYSPEGNSVGPEIVHLPDFSKLTTIPSESSPGKGSIVGVGGFVGGADVGVVVGGRGVEVIVDVLVTAAAVSAPEVAASSSGEGPQADNKQIHTIK